MLLKEQRIIKFNQINENNRIYYCDSFNLDDPIIQERIKTGTFFGELGLPDDNYGNIDLLKVSHRVVSLYKKEDGLYVDIETLETPNGKILENLIENDANIIFSVHGFGDIIMEKGYSKVNNYTICSINAIRKDRYYERYNIG